MIESGESNAVNARHEKSDRIKHGIIRKYDNKKRRVERVRDRKAAGITAEIKKLKEQEEVSSDLLYMYIYIFVCLFIHV